MEGADELVGRIGGDEFVVMRICEKPGYAETMIQELKDRIRSFNETREKDYYVEISVGYQEFVCSEDISITELMRDADKLLYIEKKNRRETIKKP